MPDFRRYFFELPAKAGSSVLTRLLFASDCIVTLIYFAHHTTAGKKDNCSIIG